MTQVYISIGSNINALHYIQNGLQALQHHYGALQLSTTYESAAVGFVGDNFYNLVVGFDTAASPHKVVATLRQIEDANGRQRSADKFNPRTLDLDLLLYGDWVSDDDHLVVPHTDIEKYAFVLQPLADLAPYLRHPLTGQTYAALWAGYRGDKQTQWQLDIAWEV